jgi:hypothetical protein
MGLYFDKSEDYTQRGTNNSSCKQFPNTTLHAISNVTGKYDNKRVQIRVQKKLLLKDELGYKN